MYLRGGGWAIGVRRREKLEGRGGTANEGLLGTDALHKVRIIVALPAIEEIEAATSAYYLPLGP